MVEALHETLQVYIPYTQFTLDNGLNVIVHRDRSLPVVAVNLWYHVGSRNERPGRTGFAHLFEHIMFEGSANVPEGDIDNLLEAAGGAPNGSTMEVTAEDVLRVASEYLDPAEMVIVIAGDHSVIREGLGLGSVTLITDTTVMDDPPQS